MSDEVQGSGPGGGQPTVWGGTCIETARLLSNRCASTMTVRLDANTSEVVILPIHGRVLGYGDSSETYSKSE